jgi:sulfate transport system permease protein
MSHRALPGFRVSLAATLTYVTLLVLIPLAACFLRAASLTWPEFWAAVWTDRAVASYKLTFGASLVAAVINVPLGLIVAWVLVRYRFPGKRLLDALVDLPFALPTAVAGLVYSSLYVKKGWLGQFVDGQPGQWAADWATYFQQDWLVEYLTPIGFHGAYSRTAIVLVLTFIGLPFVVRAVQPVLDALDAEVEEAAASLGARRRQTFLRVLLPTLLPALVTGFALALARALGEYGSVVFVSGNMPMKTEIAPVLIVSRLESFEYAEATAIAVVLLTISFGMLAIINLVERWSKRYAGQ